MTQEVRKAYTLITIQSCRAHLQRPTLHSSMCSDYSYKRKAKTSTFTWQLINGRAFIQKSLIAFTEPASAYRKIISLEIKIKLTTTSAQFMQRRRNSNKDCNRNEKSKSGFIHRKSFAMRCKDQHATQLTFYQIGLISKCEPELPNKEMTQPNRPQDSAATPKKTQHQIHQTPTACLKMETGAWKIVTQ